MAITIPCPSCGKEASGDTEHCLRCRCEITSLFQIKLQAEQIRDQATGQLREDRFRDCLLSCEQSWHSAPSFQTAELAFIAAVLHGDAFLVMRWKWRGENFGD